MYGMGGGWAAPAPVPAARHGNKYTVDEQAALAVVSNLNPERLEGLLTDEDKLNDLLNDLQQVKNLQVERETLLAENKRLAEENLEKEPKLLESRAELNKKYETMSSLREEVAINKSQLDSLCSKQSLDTTHAILQTQAVAVEENSEAMCEEFLDGKKDVETFSSEFLEKGASAHLLRIKAEKMGEIIRSKNQTRSVAQTGATNTLPSSSAGQPVVPPPVQQNNWGAQQFPPYYPRPPVGVGPNVHNYYNPQMH